MITLTTTLSGSNSNAYADVAGADARAARDLVTPQAVAWAASGNTERKKSALILATTDIDTIPSAEVDFIGEKADDDQALQFPRDYSPDEYPANLVAATIEHAFNLFTVATSDPLAIALNDKKKVEAGDVSVEWFEKSSDDVVFALSRFSALVQRLLWPLLEFPAVAQWGSGVAIRAS